MNKKKLFLKLLIIVVGISSMFLLSSCFAAIGLVSCGRNCKESCKSNNDDLIDGNEYGIYFTLSDDGDSYLVSEVGYKEYNVKIPESYNGKPVTGIKSGAFTHFQSSVGCAGSYFFGMTLSSLVLPKTIKVIEDGVFEFGGEYYHGSSAARCNEVYYEGTLEDWFKIDFGSSPFSESTLFYVDGKKVTNIEVPESITRIGANTFAMFGGLKSVTFHENVAVIEENAFYGCDNLIQLEFPCTDLTIGAYAFTSCTAVEKISFTGEKLVLENNVFSFLDSLKEVEWNSVKISVIPERAFYQCSFLQIFVVPASVQVIRSDAFRGCYNLAEVYNFSKLQIVARSETNGCVAYYAGVVHTAEDDNTYILTVGDYKFVISEAGNALFKYVGEGGALNLPVLENGESYAIREHTFNGDNRILSVNIPECVTQIGDFAFFGCKNLKIVSGCKGVLTVGERAFVGCGSLESVEFAAVEEIGNYAFNNCYYLKTFALPQSIKKIGSAAFVEASELTYAGTLEEWLQVELYNGATSPITVTCADGEVWEGNI